MADVTISSAGLRVVKLLVGNPPKSITELIKAMGVTRTAVTEQLHELESAGFVERIREKLPGRGRPRHLFRATSAALLILFANNQHLVVPAIWKAIEDCGGRPLTKKVLAHVSRELADHYSSQITAAEPKDRVRQFVRLLEQEGGLVDIAQKDGRLTISKRSCAFLSMADEQRRICSVDVDMISKIAGCPVRQVACRQDGDPCCAFEIDVPKSRGTKMVTV
jgi:DeoR family transcriptional regulator, suf operon transcriptional repressor